MDVKKNASNEEEPQFNIGLAVRKLLFSCASFVLKAAPPQPCKEVLQICMEVGIGRKELLPLYSTFHSLRVGQANDDEDDEGDEDGPPEVIVKATHVRLQVLEQLVTYRKKWVIKLFRELLHLGGCGKDQDMDWNQFLCVFLRFCSLSKVELSQALFLIIKRKSNTKVQHYLTTDELQHFFYFYKECTVRSFNTALIDFENLPLSRYYASDFAELLQRFTMLLHPILCLQQQLREKLPSRDFWEDRGSFLPYARKISSDFFLIETPRVHLRGDPPFQESCSMLAPEALGFEAVNQDQWLLRTRQARSGLGLKQQSVWGEQITPEEIAQRQDELERNYLILVELERQAEEKRRRDAEADTFEDEPAVQHAEAVEEEVDHEHVSYLPSKLAIAAAMNEEYHSAPRAELPPRWMECATIAPAPRYHDDGPIVMPILKLRATS